MYGLVNEVRKHITLHTFLEPVQLPLTQTTQSTTQNFSLRLFKKRKNMHYNDMQFRMSPVLPVSNVTGMGSITSIT